MLDSDRIPTHAPWRARRQQLPALSRSGSGRRPSLALVSATTEGSRARQTRAAICGLVEEFDHVLGFHSLGLRSHCPVVV